MSDFSDYAGNGTNAFDLGEEGVDGDGIETAFTGSATVTETILAAVPEPPTWVMALIGFAVVGFAAHGRRLARPLAARHVTNEAV